MFSLFLQDYISQQPDTDQDQNLPDDQEQEMYLDEHTGEMLPLPSEEDMAIDDYLGDNPKNPSDTGVSLSQEIIDRLETWIKKGITKEEKEVILKENPRYGNTSLEAPEVNSEVEQGLGGKAKKRDKYFQDYQNSLGSVLSANAVAFDVLFTEVTDSPLRNFLLQKIGDAIRLTADVIAGLDNTRRYFLSGNFNPVIQKAAYKLESTKLLFGDNLESFVTQREKMQKANKFLMQKHYTEWSRPCPIQRNYRPYFTERQNLNHKGSFDTGEIGRQSSYQYRSYNFYQQKGKEAGITVSGHTGRNLYVIGDP